jgi:hypothetical protein
MQLRVPRDWPIELADVECNSRGARRALTPHRAPRHARNRVVAIDVDAVQAAALERMADGFEMRQQIGVLNENGKCFGHENGCVEAALGERELFDRTAVKPQIRKRARFAPPRRNHCRRTIDPDDFEAVSRQQTPVWRIAASDIEDAARRTLAMAVPDLLQENHLGRNLARTLHMSASEDVRIFIDARFHRR